MRCDSRASECTRGVLRARFTAPRLRESERLLLSLSSFSFLILLVERWTFFSRLSAISSTRGSEAARLVSAVFFSHDIFFFHHALSKDGGSEINPCLCDRYVSCICGFKLYLHYAVFTVFGTVKSVNSKHRFIAHCLYIFFFSFFFLSLLLLF